MFSMLFIFVLTINRLIGLYKSRVLLSSNDFNTRKAYEVESDRVLMVDCC